MKKFTKVVIIVVRIFMLVTIFMRAYEQAILFAVLSNQLQLDLIEKTTGGRSNEPR